ncbi:hypothetical protein N658DRAFT_181708 [Parathielavia hyrcaniae]|uniref:Uncharacterized protein n=1 Tax=Parathielavia hyrcaniae TaxID=113614 RepID=A0AAN6QC56_9PEZI|nr:hypothetical protein N658DRAFT_181708 [Parathielavia hyrcaniae]
MQQTKDCCILQGKEVPIDSMYALSVFTAPDDPDVPRTRVRDSLVTAVTFPLSDQRSRRASTQPWIGSRAASKANQSLADLGIRGDPMQDPLDLHRSTLRLHSTPSLQKPAGWSQRHAPVKHEQRVQNVGPLLALTGWNVGSCLKPPVVVIACLKTGFRCCRCLALCACQSCYRDLL